MSHGVLRASMLIVTPAPQLQDALSRALTDDSAELLFRGDLPSGEEAYTPDLLLLDRTVLTHGERDITRLRCRWSRAQLIVVGARNPADTVALIDSGADDAIVDGDLAWSSRVRAAARRARTLKMHREIILADVRYAPDTGRLRCGNLDTRLSSIETALFACMLVAAPQLVSLGDLCASAWGPLGSSDQHATVRVYVGYLRTKLQQSHSVCIRNVHGIGYALQLKIDPNRLLKKS